MQSRHLLAWSTKRHVILNWLAILAAFSGGCKTTATRSETNESNSIIPSRFVGNYVPQGITINFNNYGTLGKVDKSNLRVEASFAHLGFYEFDCTRTSKGDVYCTNQELQLSFIIDDKPGAPRLFVRKFQDKNFRSENWSTFIPCDKEFGKTQDIHCSNQGIGLPKSVASVWSCGNEDRTERTILALDRNGVILPFREWELSYFAVGEKMQVVNATLHKTYNSRAALGKDSAEYSTKGKKSVVKVLNETGNDVALTLELDRGNGEEGALRVFVGKNKNAVTALYCMLALGN